MKSSTRRGFVLGLTTAAATFACRGKAPWAENSHQTKTSNGPLSAGSENSAATHPVPKRKLGRTGVSVSIVGLGGFHIGQKLSEQESIRLIRTAVDSGINFLDNCWDYNGGDSEVRMGNALADGYRDKVFLMTKIDGRTRKAALEQLEQSLSRLRTERIDLVQIHEIIRPEDPQRCFDSNGAVQALTEARKSGKLRFIGFTGHKDPRIHLSMLDAARKHDFRFDTVQMPLNVMDAHYRSFRKEVLPVLLRDEIGVLGMKSMGSGDILKSGVVSAEECLRYALSLPTSVVICGMDSLDVLNQNLRIARGFKPLSDGEMQALLDRTAAAAANGEYEAFKTSEKFDGTSRNPYWLEEARI
jgi:aryl-alcohol dehydrogenase-like predicted oxidoreductase